MICLQKKAKVIWLQFMKIPPEIFTIAVNTLQINHLLMALYNTPTLNDSFLIIANIFANELSLQNRGGTKKYLPKPKPIQKITTVY